MLQVRDGVNRAEFDNGIREWRARHGHPIRRGDRQPIE